MEQVADRARLLYVDDEEANLVNFKLLFEDDFEILTAKCGEEALAVFKAEDDIALVVADQRMPGMTGVELLSKILGIDPDPIRIILTAFTDVEDIIEAINRGHIYLYIQKPWEENNLRLSLKRALGTYLMARENSRLTEELKKINRELERANAELRRDIGRRKRAEEALEMRTHELEETNVAMKVLLMQSGEAKKELENNILANIRNLVIPHVEGLEAVLSDSRERVYLDVIRTNLEQITSSFTRRLSSRFQELTPRELMVADLVRQGRTNKEIAALLNLSRRTVESYRDSLREKFGIKNTNANLKSYLLSFF